MKKIFEPIKINTMELKNRMMVSAMVSNYCNSDGLATEQYIAYHEKKARGGWGLVITENYPVVADGGGFVKIPGLWDDSQIPSHCIFTDRVHAAGGKIVAQIYHAGRETTTEISGSRPVAPSAIKEPTMPEVPRELTVKDIEDLVEYFGDCALRVKKAGFDGVEIHGAHGYLINQFLSPFSNKRSDEYGGSIRNRSKFAIDIIKNVREKVGKEFPIFFRMTVVEYVDGGLTIEESKAIAMLLEEAGIDAFHCTQGVYATVNVILAPFAVPYANFINNAAEIKKVLTIPVIGVGRINNPDVAESILVSGKADMVTMARASLADPDMPNKAKEGRFEDITYCVGCMQGCSGEEDKGNPVRCLVNPFTGKESEYTIQQATTPKKVFIAGGGVAGCEASIIAAMSGHDVTIYEKSPVFGGQFRGAAIPPGKTEFNSFLAWQKTQMKKLGVTMKLGCEVNLDIVKNEQPDVLIVATGSIPNIPPIKGLDQAGAIFANDALLGESIVGKNIVVIGGGLVGAETAEHFAVHGSTVTIVEILPEIVCDGEPGPTKLLKESLKHNGVSILTSTKVVEIKGKNIIVEQNNREVILENVDSIILATGSKSCNPFSQIADLNCKVISVGDALSVKNGYRAIQEGFVSALDL